MTCEILQVIFGWFCQFTLNVINFVGMSIHKINHGFGGNVKPLEN